MTQPPRSAVTPIWCNNPHLKLSPRKKSPCRLTAKRSVFLNVATCTSCRGLLSRVRAPESRAVESCAAARLIPLSVNALGFLALIKSAAHAFRCGVEWTRAGPVRAGSVEAALAGSSPATRKGTVTQPLELLDAVSGFELWPDGLTYRPGRCKNLPGLLTFSPPHAPKASLAAVGPGLDGATPRKRTRKR